MNKIEHIPIFLLHPHPDNPRKELGDLTELAAAIEAKGVLQNLTVVPAEEGGYRIIIGHRRHAAAKLVGLTDLPCVIADMTPQEQFETMMVENIQRSDLTVYEQAEGFQLMLDMGSTVGEVAQKVGLSETTVRNRAKLMKLDKKGFQKGEARGATMTDFLKLNAIKDDDRRNKVLQSIGTADFNDQLRKAQEDEKYAEFLAGEIRKLEEADWIRERTDEKCGACTEYPYWNGISKYHQSPIERPDDTDVADYVYVISGPNEVNIYRKGPAKAKVLTAEEARFREVRETVDAVQNELSSISKRHRELRLDFVRDFTAVATNSDDIVAYAARAFLECYGSPNVASVGSLLNIAVKRPNAYNAAVDQHAWDVALRNRPYNALLCLTAAKMDGNASNYYISQYDHDTKLFVFKHKGDSMLDLYYSMLKSIGYEMSEEEIQMQNGTHPLFKQSKKLVEDYKEEIKNG